MPATLVCPKGCSRRRSAALIATLSLTGAGYGAAAAAPRAAQAAGAAAATTLTPIKHVVVIMEENHSFDNYFGTFPGADGIPSGVCAPDPATQACDPPYHNAIGYTHDLPHGGDTADIDGGRMDGFVAQEQAVCQCTTHESMGYFNGNDIPVYWRYAKAYTLQDHLFEPSSSWSFPAHLFMVSEWSAACTSTSDPMSCQTKVDPPDNLSSTTWPANQLPWTDLTWLLHRAGVSWGYYVAPGTEPDCTSTGCTAGQDTGTPSYWNPLPWFDDVMADSQLGDVQRISAFYAAAANGTLPAVSWIVPNALESGHPLVAVGAKPNSLSEPYVVSLVNAIESGRQWKSTAVFLAWDDWGGEYDHVVPPTVDVQGLGIRVAGMLISPYARKGYVDHQILSFDAYNKFIEDNFLGGQRLDPATDGRPDSRPTVRETSSTIGNLMNEFDFTQTPSAPIVFPVLTLPATMTRGTQVSVTGAHFLPGDAVSVALNCGAPDCTGGFRAAAVTVDSSGNFSARFTVPPTLPTGAEELVSAAGTRPLRDYAVNATVVD